MSDAYFEDKNLTCKERNCGQQFVFTGGEQRFYSERNFTEPTRCKPCRAAKKAARENSGPGPSYSAPPAHSAPSQVDSSSRRPVVQEMPEQAPQGRRRSSGGKRRRDEENGWGGD